MIILTPKEFALASLLHAGMKHKDIADYLNLSYSTVKIYVSNLKNKTHSETTTDIVLKFERDELIPRATRKEFKTYKKRENLINLAKSLGLVKMEEQCQ